MNNVKESNNLKNKYDVIVIGGGHAGIEASLSCSRIGLSTLMVCGAFNRIGNMPCNPSVGGPAKGILVREIDALGGEMGRAADKTALQVKMLNSSKGPAVRALRVQSDKLEYAKYMQNVCSHQENLEICIKLVDDILVEDGKICGVRLTDGTEVCSDAVVVTTGTYLSSMIMWGDEAHPKGPDGEETNYNLSKSLIRNGFKLIRLKTGTPPRVLTSSIDFSKAVREDGINLPIAFSYDTKNEDVISFNDQLPCYLVWTQPLTHKIIWDHMNESSMYSGLITGVGPRYCPSIETKLVRFKDKEQHQIFLEPESRQIPETYIQGFSTSMPHDIQDKMVKSLPGFENAVIAKYSYAIEYDAIDPTQLFPTLESKIVENLFFAGQVNGTSGYEEAAAQGLIAGLNASLKLRNMDPIVLKRDEAYIGVLIDDIVTKGVEDPYRMLTSRSEYRLLLRHDNADSRVMKYGRYAGLITDEKYNNFLARIDSIEQEKERLTNLKIKASESVNSYLASIDSPSLTESVYAIDLMKRPEVHYDDIVKIADLSDALTYPLSERVDIEVKYKGYIEKAYIEAKRMLKLESVRIPSDINYYDVPNLASEAREKLSIIKPLTIAQANRISGVNPADISMLILYIESNRGNKND